MRSSHFVGLFWGAESGNSGNFSHDMTTLRENYCYLKGARGDSFYRVYILRQ